MAITLRKLLLFLLISFLLLFASGLYSLVYAQDQASPSASAQDSAALFWPLAAGKTIDDNLYFLKQWKEKIQSVFAFSSIAKANNNVLLGTKRVLEAEKLLKDQKEGHALKTLDLAEKEFKDADENYRKAKESDPAATLDMSAIERLQNLATFLPKLAEDRSEQVKSKLKIVENKVIAVHP